MKNKNSNEENGFVRPDALKEELVSVEVIGGTELQKVPKVDVIKVVNLKKEDKHKKLHRLFEL